jgi:AcrR family transcriptional regulator
MDLDFLAIRKALTEDTAKRSREDTKIRLLVSAETLIGEKGIEAVSLREIALKADCANTSAVQYHFESKFSLLKSISQFRISQMDPIRARMLHDIYMNSDRNDVRAIMGILCRPVSLISDASNKRTYAAFMSKYLVSFRDSVYRRAFVSDDLSHTSVFIAYKMLDTALDFLPQAIRRARILSFYLMYVNALSQIDVAGGLTDIDEDSYLDDVINMASAALMAPYISKHPNR